jgi:putative DNA primase/helicase
MIHAQTAAKQLTISTGTSRKSMSWKSLSLSWEQLSKKLSTTTRTPETQAEYTALPKAEQDEIKDVGGFVGGTLKEGRRRKGSVAWRSLLTLDADHIKGDLWSSVTTLFDHTALVYSTHKHTDAHPRLRLVIPLSSPITADQYEPICRKIAADLGIDFFDDTTYEAHRLMYWPSTSADAPFVSELQDSGFLDPQEILQRYADEGLDWRDPFHWPRSSRETVRRERELKKAGDPRTKSGVIGAFCRAYSIEEAIEEYLSEVYTEAQPGRYTYAQGSTFGGVVVYDSLFSYSHHESDPAGRQLCNAFDLVRLHLYGERDDGSTASITRLPSYKAMLELAQEDSRVKTELIEAQRESAREDFADPLKGDDDDEWMKQLQFDGNGACLQTIGNARLVLDHDPRLAGRIAWNEFSHALTITGDLPWHQLDEPTGDRWRDADDSGLRLYLEQGYGIKQPSKIADALTVVAQRRKYHPVRDYLHGLRWDGVPRVERLLIDYLAAEDSEYVRTVTRKALAAAVARVMSPGVKWDYMLTLYGRQGVGKSFFVKTLAGPWYSDSVNTFNGKEAYEQLQGAWILEVAELSATKKSETEATKHFISKSEDMFRVAYGKHVTRFPRQCIFIGTTNDAEFLRDRTGNRRFWPVTVGLGKPRDNLFTLDQETIDLVWAEAVEIWRAKEPLYLTGEMEKAAMAAQEWHMEDNPKVGQIIEFLDMELPENWDEMPVEARRRHIHGTEFGVAEGLKRREKVCAMEILVELFQKDAKWIKPFEVREINDILRTVVNWGEHESADQGRLKFGRLYGKQKAFTRLW